MSAKPDYFSCVRCGYGGICRPEDHECDAARVVAAEHRQPLARGPLFSRRAALSTRSMKQRASSADDDADHDARVIGLDRVIRQVSRLVGRHVEVARDVNWRLAVTQRCTVCRGEMTKTIAWPGRELLFAIVKAVCHTYLLHRCKPVDESLFSLSAAELDNLAESMDRDLVRLAERLEEVRALAKERG